MTALDLSLRPRRWLPGPTTRWAASGLLALGLTACGGGEDSGSAGDAAVVRADTAAASPSAATNDSNAPPAWLTAQTLEEAEKAAVSADAATETAPLESLPPGTIAPKRAYDSGEVARKAAAVRIPVYRFYNRQTSAHFYTTSETERANIVATMPQFNFDGPAFEAASEFAPGLSPVYRFYNSQNGVHFYTISEAEKNTVLATLPQYSLEGTAYHASQVAGQGLVPLYRFYLPAKGFHFYTASATERDSIQTNLSATYSYEGVGYYVPSGTWNADKLPHTGLTTDQCYGYNILVANSDFFGTCGGSGGGFVSLNRSLAQQQDSGRTDKNPMSYSRVLRFTGFLFTQQPVNNCVYDNVTGLTWEGKTDDGGLRDKDNTYTNQGGGAGTDASGYVAAVNASNLCGHGDWRMPTTLELLSLIDYGRTDAAPYLNPTWFPNVGTAAYHWTGDARGATNKWTASFGDRWDHYSNGTSAMHVRLVRGSMGNVSGGRYSYTTLAHGSDAANNVVNDHLTGLQWRRCVEGKTWNGTACTGTASTFTHREALVHSNDVTLRSAGWRLPNVKEGISVVNKAATAAPYIDGTAFPGTGSSTVLWTSTGATLDTPLTTAHGISMSAGWINSFSRTNAYEVRLVR